MPKGGLESERSNCQVSFGIPNWSWTASERPWKVGRSQKEVFHSHPFFRGYVYVKLREVWYQSFETTTPWPKINPPTKLLEPCLRGLPCCFPLCFDKQATCDLADVNKCEQMDKGHLFANFCSKWLLWDCHQSAIRWYQPKEYNIVKLSISCCKGSIPNCPTYTYQYRTVPSLVQYPPVTELPPSTRVKNLCFQGKQNSPHQIFNVWELSVARSETFKTFIPILRATTLVSTSSSCR